MTDDTVRESYDRVPYTSGSEHRAHPDHLATLATLHRLEPTPPERSRVLEIGCADGGNLIPMAIEFPESRIVGIDISPRQIEEGVKATQELGLTNVSLRAMSLIDVEPSFGVFDYIICHGV